LLPRIEEEGIMGIRSIRNIVSALAAACVVVAATAVQAQTEVSFYYPVAVGGPITKIIDGFAADFEKENPGIKLKPIYSGSYQESITKALTAVKSGEPPVTSILLSTDMFTLIDEDAIVPFDDLVKTADDRAWLASFYPAFMENSQTGGKTWGIPFQRSTIVLYYNKELFKEAGLDPNKPPATWNEMTAYAEKLTKRDASGKVTQWGVQIPSSGFPYWLFQGLAIENGAILMNSAGTETYYDKPEVIGALQYWVDLVKKYKVHPEGIVEWGTTPKDFFEKKVAMVWTTTGNLTNVKTNAKFDFGVAMLPAGKQRGSPTGGGNFYIFAKSTPAQRDAAFKFIKWVTTPQRAAQWGIDTGYVAVRGDAWETPVMKQYVAGFPAAAVARDQLPYAKAELSTHENQRVTKALNDGLQAALTGTKTPEAAMKDAQRESERILRPFKK
jgi:sn-glycerol 3-phosphate transport system substrate-binding protein